jgi:folate-binding protein YgfZ
MSTIPISLDQLCSDKPDLTAIDQIPPALTMISDMSSIWVTGDDAESFLQGQFTNDLTTISTGQQQLSAYCNPKGRALGIFYLLRDRDGFQMIVPADLAELLINRLQLYKMRSKLNIALRDDVTLIGGINCPQEAYSEGSEYRVIDQNRHLIIAESGTEQQITTAADIPVADQNLWKLGQILSGIPQVYLSTYEDFIPQQINLDLVAGVSFTKGCYPGQEIIARIRYLGKVKQRMICASIKSDLAVEPGTAIYSRERADQKSGTIVDAVTIGNRIVALAMIPFSSFHQGDLALGTSDGPKLQRIPLPYSVSDENSDEK